MIAGLRQILVCALVGRSAPRPIISAAGADDVLAAASMCHRELTGHPESKGEEAWRAECDRWGEVVGGQERGGARRPYGKDNEAE